MQLIIILSILIILTLLFVGADKLGQISSNFSNNTFSMFSNLSYNLFNNTQYSYSNASYSAPLSDYQINKHVIQLPTENNKTVYRIK